MDITKIIANQKNMKDKEEKWDFCVLNKIPIIIQTKKRKYSNLFLDNDTMKEFDDLLFSYPKTEELEEQIDLVKRQFLEQIRIYIEDNSNLFKEITKKGSHVLSGGRYLLVEGIINEHFEQVAKDFLSIYIESWKEVYPINMLSLK